MRRLDGEMLYTLGPLDKYDAGVARAEAGGPRFMKAGAGSDPFKLAGMVWLTPEAVRRAIQMRREPWTYGVYGVLTGLDNTFVDPMGHRRLIDPAPIVRLPQD